jgi:hypothetical protein
MKNTNNIRRKPKAWFKITGRHMRVSEPVGKVLTFWLGAPSRELALERCEELRIVEIEFCEEDPSFEERLG